jgi:hypothetical protein
MQSVVPGRIRDAPGRVALTVTSACSASIGPQNKAETGQATAREHRLDGRGIRGALSPG